MKNSFFYPILLSMTGSILIFACEKADIQKPISPGQVKIEPREIDDCSDCVTDCCCQINYVSGQPSDLELCGTSSPEASTTACGPSEAGSCEISGFIENLVVSSTHNPLFCVAQNTPFYINASSTTSVGITCQVGQAMPQTVSITFNSPGAKPYWIVNGSCELVSCF